MTAPAGRTREPVKLARDRELNFIYFLDSSKTHTFKIKLRTFRYVMGAAGAFVTCSLLSFYLLFRIEENRQATLSDLRRSQTTIFDYQTKYDSIYQLAYPSSQRTPKNANAAQSVSAAIVPTPMPDHSPRVAASQQPVAAQTVTPVPAQAKPVSERNPVASDVVENSGERIKLNFLPVTLREGSSITLVAESPGVVVDKQTIRFQFDLRNAESAARAEGRLYIVAVYEDDGGRKVFVSEPRTMRIGPDGRAANPERGVRFSVSNFLHREFKIAIPALGGGTTAAVRLTEIMLVLGDKSGSEMVEFRAPVNVRLASRK